MNGEVCCILGVCCPPNSAASVQALAVEMEKARLYPDKKEAHACAKWMLENFDLAPKGTVAPLIAAIAKMAKHA